MKKSESMIREGVSLILKGLEEEKAAPSVPSGVARQPDSPDPKKVGSLLLYFGFALFFVFGFAGYFIVSSQERMEREREMGYARGLARSILCGIRPAVDSGDMDRMIRMVRSRWVMLPSLMSAAILIAVSLIVRAAVKA